MELNLEVVADLMMGYLIAYSKIIRYVNSPLKPFLGLFLFQRYHINKQKL